MALTSTQPTMRASFRKHAFSKPANDKGIQNLSQVKPALRLPAERYQQSVKKTVKNKIDKYKFELKNS